MTTGSTRDRRVSAAAANAGVDELVPRAQQEMLNYCRARVDPGCAEDVAQETCAAVLQFLPRYRPRRGDKPFRAFVYGIAAHKVADARRARARSRAREHLVDQAPETLSGEQGPHERALAAERRDAVARLLAGLSRERRRVLVLRVMEGRSAADTAGILGVTPGSVRVTQHRALTELRAGLAPSPVAVPAALPKPGRRPRPGCETARSQDGASPAVRR
ncbi:sigma-70 family RNA polymerase sigma factor [Amycolatopsis rubida]|uniref:RNA polymerase sigma-70 factor, ECF subfamily n=1 Tax=Amycolatopsis rubida TaxID=112413 RepID=A0A1I5E3P3_9PSEU|nr:sigma-70 family RNA polymerase sigma factor [Amycolatopsis rubida]SFO05900.1 RNA polymerase sigma-70 factor, ECF subfamily [Amycolatopsis rubida]